MFRKGDRVRTTRTGKVGTVIYSHMDDVVIEVDNPTDGVRTPHFPGKSVLWLYPEGFEHVEEEGAK
jgi:hypothetical protein